MTSIQNSIIFDFDAIHKKIHTPSGHIERVELQLITPTKNEIAIINDPHRASALNIERTNRAFTDIKKSFCKLMLDDMVTPEIVFRSGKIDFPLERISLRQMDTMQYQDGRPLFYAISPDGIIYIK